jgi:hypothetical protein
VSSLYGVTCVFWVAMVSAFAATVNAATAHIASGPLNISGQNGAIFENLHVTNPSGPCVMLTNSSNITIHNSEVGPCGAQAITTNGGNNIRVLDSYLHAETPGIVGRSGNQATFDTGDNIYCNNTTNLLIQGNVIGWGEANVFLRGCGVRRIQGKLLLQSDCLDQICAAGDNAFRCWTVREALRWIKITCWRQRIWQRGNMRHPVQI